MQGEGQRRGGATVGDLAQHRTELARGGPPAAQLQRHARREELPLLQIRIAFRHESIGLIARRRALGEAGREFARDRHDVDSGAHGSPPLAGHSAQVRAGFPEACDNGPMRDACAVVLAGGESRRFGSDKALAQFRGEPLIARVVRELRAAGFAQLALAAKDPDKYAAAAGGAEPPHDVPPLQTPPARLPPGLRAAPHPLRVAPAADMPFSAGRPLIDALIGAIAGHDAAVPQAGRALPPPCPLWRRGPPPEGGGELLRAPRAMGAPARLAPV